MHCACSVISENSDLMHSNRERNDDQDDEKEMDLDLNGITDSEQAPLLNTQNAANSAPKFDDEDTNNSSKAIRAHSTNLTHSTAPLMILNQFHSGSRSAHLPRTRARYQAAQMGYCSSAPVRGTIEMERAQQSMTLQWLHQNISRGVRLDTVPSPAELGLLIRRFEKYVPIDLKNPGIGGIYIGKEIISQIISRCNLPFDEKLAFYYYRESKAMQIINEQISVVMTVWDNLRGKECKVLLLNIDLYFRGTDLVMYLVAMVNDPEFRTLMKWKIVCLSTATQIFSRFGIPKHRLPHSSRVPLMMQLSNEWNPKCLSPEDAVRMIIETDFSKLPSKCSKRQKCTKCPGKGKSQCKQYEGTSRVEIEMTESKYARDIIPTLPFPVELVALCGDYSYIEGQCRCGHSAADHGIVSGQQVNSTFKITSDCFKSIAATYWTHNRPEFAPVVVNAPEVCQQWSFVISSCKITRYFTWIMTTYWMHWMQLIFRNRSLSGRQQSSFRLTDKCTPWCYPWDSMADGGRLLVWIMTQDACTINTDSFPNVWEENKDGVCTNSKVKSPRNWRLQNECRYRVNADVFSLFFSWYAMWTATEKSISLCVLDIGMYYR